MKWQNDIAFTKGTTWHTWFRNKHKITNRTVTNFTFFFFFFFFFQFHVNPFKYPEMEVKATCRTDGLTGQSKNIMINIMMD